MSQLVPFLIFQRTNRKIVLKHLLFILLLLFTFCNTLSAQKYRRSTNSVPTARVSFVVQSSKVSPQELIYVTGNTSSFGPWNPQRLALLKLEDGTWIGTCKLPLYEPIELKFTRGSFETEESDVNGQPLVHQFILMRDTIIKDRIRYWKDQQIGQNTVIVPDNAPLSPDVEPTPEPVKIVKPPFVFVRKHTDLIGEGVTKRDITVYLPKSYETDEYRSYPVLYVHNGQQRYYSSNTFNGQDWEVSQVAKDLMQSGQIEDVIVVDIHNQNDVNFRLYSADFNKNYRSFLTENLKPFIDQNYRTLQDPLDNASMGADMGGLWAFALAWESPHQFGKAICFSPIFDFTRYYVTYCKKVRETPDYRNIRIYFDNGVSTKEKRLEEGIERMLNVLYQKGYTPSFQNRKEFTRKRVEDALLNMFRR